MSAAQAASNPPRVRCTLQAAPSDNRFEMMATTEQAIGDFLVHNADYARRDRLWPAHYLVFATNPLSVAYGACGPALFLHESTGKLDLQIVHWLRSQALSVETHPPGLFPGLAGIASTYWRLGLDEEAREAMALAYRSPLLWAEPCLYFGIAGWGMVSLEAYLRTREQGYLDHAARAGDALIRSAEHHPDGQYWRTRQDGLVHYGFGFGASGIALFLLYLHEATGNDRYRTHACRALEYDIAHKVESKVGWQWKRYEDDTVLYPYWIHGSAGIGSVLIRFHQLTGEARYAELARRVADAVTIKYAFVPSLFEGLAGIGEFLLDMHIYTGEERYLQDAVDVGATILWFRVNTSHGVAFPGRWLTRLACDYATGAAGIGLFLSRLRRPRSRPFVDIVSEPPTRAGRAS